MTRDKYIFRKATEEDSSAVYMRLQAAVKIDREIGGNDTPMPEPPVTDTEPICDTAEGNASIDTSETFTPYKGKYCKPGTGYLTMIKDHLYQGRFTPRVNGKRVSKNVYAKTREECEEKLAELIKAMKEDIKVGKIA